MAALSFVMFMCRPVKEETNGVKKKSLKPEPASKIKPVTNDREKQTEINKKKSTTNSKQVTEAAEKKVKLEKSEATRGNVRKQVSPEVLFCFKSTLR